jgi:hemolysin activation/secretion protein
MRLVAPFLGLRLGAGRIDLLLRRITAAYIERGYITTRAYLGPQNLASGRLEITIVPGLVENILINGKPLEGAAVTALPTAPGERLRLADLEQATDQINRLRSQRAETQILPGQTPGGSVIAIASKPDKPWRLQLATDNYGQPATGEGRTRAAFEADNLLGAWEAWAFNLVEARDSEAQTFSFSVPFGYSTFSYAHSSSKYRLPIGSIAVLRGDSRNNILAWNSVLGRDARSRTALDASLAMRESWRHIDDIALVPQKQAALRIALSRQHRFAAGSVSAELGVTHGLDAIGADTDLPGLPDTAPHNQYEKYDLNLNAALALGPNWAYLGSFNAQTSRVGLPGAEQLFLGGAGSIRGFKEGIVAGDRGHFLRNELQWTGGLPRAAMQAGARLAPFAFADFGQARLLIERDSRSLAAMGLGLRASWKAASLELAWGRPIDTPPGVAREDRVHALFSLQF